MFIQKCSLKAFDCKFHDICNVDITLHSCWRWERLFPLPVRFCMLVKFHSKIFFFELLLIPKSTITVTKEERFPNNKAVLKNKLKIEVSKRNATIHITVVDGCAALYHIHWQKDAKVQDFVNSFGLCTSKIL